MGMGGVMNSACYVYPDSPATEGLVTPDITFPDRYRLIDVGERENSKAMDWSKLNALSYDQEVFEITNKDFLIENSKKRIADKEVFTKLYDQGEWYKQNREKTSYSLNLESHQVYLEQKDEKSKKFKNLLSEKIDEIKVSNLPQDLGDIQFDETTIARNESWLKNLNKDIYVEETLSIMRDLIQGKSYTAISDKSD